MSAHGAKQTSRRKAATSGFDPLRTSKRPFRYWVGAATMGLKVRANMNRRNLILAFGGAAATWPFSVRAQQPAMPVIGFLSSGSLERDRNQLAAFHQGLAKLGYVEGRNRSYRISLDRRPDRAVARAGRRVGRPTGGGHSYRVYAASFRSQSSDANHSNRYSRWRRSGGSGFGAKPRTSGRQYYGLSLDQHFVVCETPRASTRIATNRQIDWVS